MTQTEWCLKVDFALCLCDSVVCLCDCQGHTPISVPLRGTRSCFGYEEAGVHAYSTYRDTQIHPDASFGGHVGHVITLDG